MITIYHNPRCSKSRETFALVQKVSEERGLPLTVVDYLKSPLTLEELTALHQQLGIPLREMVRDNEEQFATLGLEHANEDAILQAVAEHPQLMQRPIVTYRGQARIGRPPERVLDLFETK